MKTGHLKAKTNAV